MDPQGIHVQGLESEGDRFEQLDYLWNLRDLDLCDPGISPKRYATSSNTPAPFNPCMESKCTRIPVVHG